MRCLRFSEQKDFSPCAASIFVRFWKGFLRACRLCPPQRTFAAGMALGAVCALAQPAMAESFRVRKTHLVSVGAAGGSETVRTGINDALVLMLPEDRTFIQGVELSFKVPQIVASWRDSVAWSVYNDISGTPKENRIDYNGTRATVGTFGNSLSLNLQIPLGEENAIKKSAYATLLDIVPDTSKGFVFLRLQLAMKGTSEEITDAKFEITVKPILINKGKLAITVAPPSGTELKPYTAFVDGKSWSHGAESELIETGVHNISLVSDFYRNEVRTITIEQAQTTVVAVTFRDITPTLRIAAPEGTVLFLDGRQQPVSPEPFFITQGEHSIRCIVGDYEIVKTITAMNGRSYTVALTMDAAVLEDE